MIKMNEERSIKEFTNRERRQQMKNLCDSCQFENTEKCEPKNQKFAIDILDSMVEVPEKAGDVWLCELYRKKLTNEDEISKIPMVGSQSSDFSPEEIPII